MAKSKISSLSCIFSACILILAYSLSTATPELGPEIWLPHAFQIACWAFAWFLLVQRSKGFPRFSDPAVLLLLWSGMYFIYPSVVWIGGGYIPTGRETTNANVAFVFWLHGLFILGFIVGHLLIRKRTNWSVPKLDLQRLPSGWGIYLILLAPLLFESFVRLISGQGLLPKQTYGEKWYGMYENIRAAQSAGGVAYLVLQIKSKLYFFPILIQGIGAGLIIAHSVQQRKNYFRNTIFLLTGTVLMLLLGSGGRSSVMIILIIGLIFADLTAGPLRWRYLVFLFLLMAILFQSFRYYRAVNYLGFNSAFEIVKENIFNRPGGVANLDEFTGMLGKETFGIWIFQGKKKEGLLYLAQNILAPLPKQILPLSLQEKPTNQILSTELLGELALAGAGVAGAIIVDGYRLAGVPGIPILAAILGLIFAVAQNWLTKGVPRGAKGPMLLKIILIAGLYGCLYNLIRSSFGTIITMLFYWVCMPWILVNFILAKYPNNILTSHLPILDCPHYRVRSIVDSKNEV
jgi:hypothetical protein